MTNNIREAQINIFGQTDMSTPKKLNTARERLAVYGPSELGLTDLLSVIAGEKYADAMERLASERPQMLVNMSEQDIMQYGISKAVAAKLVAAFALSAKLAEENALSRPVIKSPQDVFDLIAEQMRYLEKEVFKVLVLNTKNRILAVDTTSIGTLNASMVHPREVFTSVLRQRAAAIILVHNHPSGDPEPSGEDVNVTKRLSEAGEILGIKVLDHIVIGGQKYKSIKEMGII